jgi:hypothetical protein
MSDEIDAIMKQKFGSNDRFDFEQQITKCWFIVDDLKELDEMIFEEYVKFNKDSISNHILGIANSYDVKFHKLWHLYETVYMDTVKENKMLNEECAALRAQLQESDPDAHGYGITAIKPNKKDKK